MSLFSTVIEKAKSGELPASVDHGYYASNEFRERASFEGPMATKDQVSILLYMMTRVALDPQVEASMRADLNRGYVILSFFGVTNPVPWVLLNPESPEVAALKAAMDENLTGPLNKAVNRVLKWRTMERAVKRNAGEAGMMNKYRESLDWPTPEDYKKNREAATARSNALCDAMNRKLDALRDRRLLRLSLLSEASRPDMGGWYGLLEDVALHALTPVH